MQLISNRTDICLNSSASPRSPPHEKDRSTREGVTCILTTEKRHLLSRFLMVSWGRNSSGTVNAFKKISGIIKENRKKGVWLDVCFGREPTRHSSTCRSTLPHISTVHLLCCVATESLGTSQTSAEATPPKHTHSHTCFSHFLPLSPSLFHNSLSSRPQGNAWIWRRLP